MERRIILFLILSTGILLLYSSLAPRPLPPQPQPAQKEVANKADGKAAEKNKELPKPAANQPAVKLEKPKKPAPVIQAAPQPAVPEQWVTLGSADSDDPYRMLVTLTNKGAAVARIELNSPRYCDIDHRHGYLGHLVMNPLGPGKGCLVQAVGAGTPAAKAGLQPGDVLKLFDGKDVADAESLEALLKNTKPRQTVQIVFTHGGQQMTKPARLTRIPLEVIKPENDDPFSMLLTLDAFDGLKLSTQWLQDVAIFRLYSDLKLGDREIADLDQADVKLKEGEGKIRIPGESANEKQWIPIPDDVRKVLAAWIDKRGKKAGPLFCQLPLAAAQERLAAQAVHRIIARVRLGVDVKDQPPPSFELEGVNLRTANWKIVPTGDKNVAKFRYLLPEKDLEISKTYRLAKVPAESQKDESYRGYHLEFEIAIHNVAKDPGESHKVAYRLDGPNGLPTEGAWYASRVTRCGGMGLREFIISMDEQTPEMVDAVTIAGGKGLPGGSNVSPERMLTFIGVDAQYFSAVLMPQRKNPEEVWFEELMPIYVGKVDAKQPKMTNTSCRLVSVLKELKPGEMLTHRFTFFAGPKKESIVEPYGLGELIYFGWPIYKFVAVPLTHILHFFYAVVGNYGLAIILLTVLVRGCMFPLSLKQAAGAQKMQMLQPELKKLQEKHKGNTEARAKAQQELFRKHNYHPLSGCLPIFIQMPVFIGLYRSLMVAIELRDAPLFTNSIRWCSNLAGPDMLVDWHAWGWPPWFNEGGSMFALGPYFNLLPLLTIVLFIVQQKMFMPPAADEQAAMTQKMMKYMMIFMGVMFYKVASGLCIYFIASSLWGLAERRFLPKTTPPTGSGGAETRAEAKARERAAAATKKKK
ncbi:MAG: membrane protein insertase YidC [Thermoguttaceae bacterium]|jgi:YidC/Oxa1 family membrane protein insertase